MKYPIMYLYFHNSMAKSSFNGILSRKKALSIIGKHCHYFLPKHLKYEVLEEMEQVGLIKKVNKTNIEVLRMKSAEMLGIAYADVSYKMSKSEKEVKNIDDGK